MAKNTVKIFVTGDNHFGLKYGRYEGIKDTLVQSRYDSLNRAVEQAEKENCDFFVVTGDLFDNTTVSEKVVKSVVQILSKFNNRVLVLPGNHDFYTGEEKVWSYFENALAQTTNNIILIKDMQPLPFEDENICFYPAFCQSKHSQKNNLSWIKEADIGQTCINVGLAHGAIQGIAPDMNNEYFLMTEQELNSIPVDAWLVGHVHISYPNNLSINEDVKGFKIFNAGTHEQTDLSNNTEGNCFVITINKDGENFEVLAHKYISGKIRYYDLKLNVSDKGLKQDLTELVAQYNDDSIIRVVVEGSVQSDEYVKRHQICEDVLSRFLTYEKNIDNLSEIITKEKIREEFAEIGFASKFLEQFIDNPNELQLAYDLIKDCQE